MKIKSYPLLILMVIIVLAIGSSGSVFTSPSIPTWYASLEKPFFTPPNWLFAPAWTTLFILMGIALYLVWQEGIDKKPVRQAVYVFGFQLALNVLWSLLFFGLQSPLLGFIEIVVLWIAILWTIIRFHGVSKPAAYLLIPYIAWVTFASALNLSVLLLN